MNKNNKKNKWKRKKKKKKKNKKLKIRLKIKKIQFNKENLTFQIHHLVRKKILIFKNLTNKINLKKIKMKSKKPMYI